MVVVAVTFQSTKTWPVLPRWGQQPGWWEWRKSLWWQWVLSRDRGGWGLLCLPRATWGTTLPLRAPVGRWLFSVTCRSWQLAHRCLRHTKA